MPSVAGALLDVRPAGDGGVIAPLLTTLLAFLVGGLVVLVTGKNPLTTYQAIFDGTGLNWFFHVGTPRRHPFTTTHIWFPWNTGTDGSRGTSSRRCS